MQSLSWALPSNASTVKKAAKFVESVRLSEESVWRVLFKRAPALLGKMFKAAITLHSDDHVDGAIQLLQAILSFIGDCSIISLEKHLLVLKERGFDWEACLGEVIKMICLLFENDSSPLTLLFVCLLTARLHLL